MSTYPDFGDSPITREYLSSYTKFELLNFVMEILSKFYETSKALVNAIAERDELRQMLNGCDIAGPELMAEIERLTAELKPCPFCGCTDIKMDFGPLHCRDCRKEYVNAATVDVLRERWNTRPIEDAQAAEIERLTAENATLRAENARLADEVRRLEYYFPEAN